MALYRIETADHLHEGDVEFKKPKVHLLLHHVFRRCNLSFQTKKKRPLRRAHVETDPDDHVSDTTMATDDKLIVPRARDLNSNFVELSSQWRSRQP